MFLLFFLLAFTKVDAQEILNGTYKIESALSSNLVLDVKNGNLASGENVLLGVSDDSDSQKWIVKYLGSDYYSITSFVSNNLSLDVKGGGLTNGTNVQLYSNNSTMSQRWIIKSAGNGYFYIISKRNNLNVDVAGGNATSGTNIQMYKGNGTAAQKFKFVELYNKTIEDGSYIIDSKLSSSSISLVDVADNSVNVILNQTNSNYKQIWNINYIENGYYQLSAQTNDEMFLSIQDNKVKNGANVEVNDKSDLECSNWLIKDNYDGTYSIVSALNNNYYLDITGGKSANGTNIQIYTGNGTNAQKFTFTKVDTSPLEEGIYNISPTSNNNVALALNNVVPVSGGNIELADKNDSNNQKWYVKSITDNIYEIKSLLDDNYVFDVASGSTSNGANIQLYKSNSTVAQQWYIIKLSDGSYRLTGVGSSKCIDITSGKITKGTNIQIYQNNNTISQKFSFTKVTPTNIEQIVDNGDFIFYSAINSNKSLRCNTDVIIYDVEGLTNDIISLEYIKDGYYALKNDNKAFTNSSGKVMMKDYEGSNEQLWYIIKTGEYYTFVSKADGKVLDITSAKTNNGNKLQTYTSNNTAAQKFNLVAVQQNVFETGYYTISFNDKLLGLNTDIAYNGLLPTLQTDKNLNRQTWYIKNVGDNLYEIKYALNPNKVLDVTGGSVANGTKVQMYTSNSSAAQRWHIIMNKDGSYMFVAKGSHSCLTVDSGTLKIYSFDKSKQQSFTVEKTSDIIVGQTIADGYYTVSTVLDENKMLDVTSGIMISGTNVQIYDSNSSIAQIWKFQYLSDGFYKVISALNPKRVLASYGDNVRIETDNGADNQKWYVKNLENNQVSLISASNSLYIDVSGGKTNNGTNVGVYASNDTNSQKFILNSYAGTKTYHGIDVSVHQSSINWTQIANSSIQFAIIRIGYGVYSDQKDKNFESNYTGATNNGIPVGVYTYSYAMNTSDAKKEAELTLQWLDGKELDLPIFYDLEDADNYKKNHGGIPNYTTMTNIAETFCSEIIKNGYKCGIYASKNWLINNMDAEKLAEKYPIWVAHYTGPDDYSNAEWHKTDYNLTSYMFWQFSSLGQVNGISTSVDLDFGYDIFD